MHFQDLDYSTVMNMNPKNPTKHGSTADTGPNVQCISHHIHEYRLMTESTVRFTPEAGQGKSALTCETDYQMTS